MNERIKELAEQSGLVRGGYANGTNIMTWRESFDNPGSLEKFAELIVRECAEFVQYKAEKSMSQEILYVGDDLLKHFGVE